MAQESWYVRNTTNRSLAISDLSKCPFIDAGKRIDLLRYHTKVEIDRSTALPELMNRGWLSISKTNPNPNVKSIKLSEADEITSQIASTTSSSSSTESNFSSIQTKTSNYSVTSDNQVILADASSSAITLTLPSAEESLNVRVKKIDSSSNTVTIDGNGATIDGSSTLVLANQYDAVYLLCDGTNWYII